MKRIYSIILLLIVFVSVFFLFTIYPAFGKINSLLELIENSKMYDGKTVTCEGEVVGDIMVRKAGVWINLEDNGVAMGVFVPKEIYGSGINIKYTGGYKAQGDILQINGIFNRTDGEHNEEMDIHAFKITVVKEGHLFDLKINQNLVLITIIIIFILCILMYVYHRPLLKSKKNNKDKNNNNNYLTLH
jgi:preprotein translocase subunit YajC